MFKKLKPLKVVKCVVEKIEKIGKKEKNEDEPPDEIKDEKNQAPQQTLLSWKQIKYIPKFFSKKEKVIIKSAVIAIIICLVLMAYLFLGDNLIEKPKQGGVYTENIIGSPQYINPLYSSIGEPDRDLVRLLFAGLIKFDENQKIVPDLAREWFIDDAQTTYTFQLREDIYWPDEKKFTSEDVVFTFEAIKNPDYQSPIRASWSSIEIKALDDSIVQFTLPEPFAPFLENLTVGILPAHLWQDILPENAILAELNLKPVGLGPYKFDSFIKDKQGYIKSYTLKRNDDYHFSHAYIDEITFKFQPTFEMAVDSLKNKNADGLNFLPLNLKKGLEQRKDLKYYSLSLPQYTAIFFNQENNLELKNKKLREALQLSIDKNMMVANILENEGVAVDGPILPGFPGYDKDKLLMANDTEQAVKLLAELGWKKKKIEIEEDEINKNDENGETDGDNNQAVDAIEQQAGPEVDAEGMSKFLFKEDKELTVVLTLAHQPQAIATGELIQKFWRAIGVKTILNIVEINQIQKEVITPREFEALLFGEILGADFDLYGFWHSSQIGNGGLNLANFKNSQADALLEKIRKEEDEEKKTEHYLKFEEILAKEIPAIFLYNPNYTYVVSNKVKGITVERIVTSADRLNGIEKWYIKTRKGFK